jgi:hypothetical protein
MKRATLRIAGVTRPALDDTARCGTIWRIALKHGDMQMMRIGHHVRHTS